MERRFLAAPRSGDDASWLPLPSTVGLWGFPSIGSRASSSAAQLNSASPGTRGWFELCPAMERGGRVQPATSAATSGVGRAGMVAVAVGQPPPFFTALCIVPFALWMCQTASRAACLAFQVLDPPTEACETVAAVTLCPLLPHMCPPAAMRPAEQMAASSSAEVCCCVSLAGL